MAGIRSKGIDRDGTPRTFVLMREDGGQAVELDETVVDFRGEDATVQGGRAPHKPGSTGRVYVDEGNMYEGEYFPGVYGLIWRPVAEYK